MNVETFFDLSDVREKLARWRQDYNQVRPHSALGDRTPEEFARLWHQEWSEDSARTAGPAEMELAGAVHGASASDPESIMLSAPSSEIVKDGDGKQFAQSKKRK